MKARIVVLCSMLGACATQLTDAGSQVRVNRSAEEVAHCKRIKFIYETRGSVSDGVAEATRAAMNDAAAAGANTIYVQSSSVGARGSSVVATAYSCK
ncbi:MAG: hypothetical protein JWR16_792 [Nevskia sp.]|nr:hypothetical protein [Nevskia sp.]